MARRRNSSGVEGILQAVFGLLMMGVMMVYLRSPQDGRKLMAAIPTLVGWFIGLAVLALFGFIALRVIQKCFLEKPSNLFAQSGTGSSSAHSYIHRPHPANPYAGPDPKSLAQEISELDWFQFEKLAELIYSKNGYHVDRRGGANPDGGIDLVISRDLDSWGVQCKHWKSWKVGVQHVREFMGALQDSRLRQGFLLTSKGFTTEAEQLATRNGVGLVGPEELLKLLRLADAEYDPAFRRLLTDPRKVCPKCEHPMVLRTATRGRAAGSRFWGCTQYPHCRFTMKLPSSSRLMMAN